MTAKDQIRLFDLKRLKKFAHINSRRVDKKSAQGKIIGNKRINWHELENKYQIEINNLLGI